MVLSTSPAGYGLIKQSEGLSLKPYVCPSGKVTIGWGSTRMNGQAVTMQDASITPERAEQLLRDDVTSFERGVRAALGKRLENTTQGQFDALVCFAYNVGLGNLRSSTLLKKHLAGDPPEEVAKQFGRWVYGTHNGKKVMLNGLITRREREAKLYQTGNWK